MGVPTNSPLRNASSSLQESRLLRPFDPTELNKFYAALKQIFGLNNDMPRRH